MIILSGEQPKQKQQPRRKTLMDAHGVYVGGSIEWGHGNSAGLLSEKEKAVLCECCNWKTVKTGKALAVKSLMATKSCAQIVQHFKGRKGYKESTVKNIHRALSRVAGEGF